MDTVEGERTTIRYPKNLHDVGSAREPRCAQEKSIATTKDPDLRPPSLREGSLIHGDRLETDVSRSNVPRRIEGGSTLAPFASASAYVP